MTSIRPVDSVGARFEEFHRKAPTISLMENSHELFQASMGPFCSCGGHRALFCFVDRAGIEEHPEQGLRLR
jgi:hypothetical protein